MPGMGSVEQARHDLVALSEECGRPGWDGGAARRVDPSSVSWAHFLLNLLPTTGLPAPMVGADPDGQVTLEWYYRPDHVVSISLDPQGVAHYAYVNGDRRRSGTEPISWDLLCLLGLRIQIVNAHDGVEKR